MLIPIFAHAAGGSGSHGFPPLHPMLVNFTAALVPAAIASDLAARIWKRQSLKAGALWMITLASALTPLTALFGWLWMRSMEDMDHWQMKYHMWMGIAFAVILIPFAIWRWSIEKRREWASWAYLLVGVALFTALAIQGDLGGSMSFGRGILIRGERSRGEGHHHDEAGAMDAEHLGHDHGTSGAVSEPPHHHAQTKGGNVVTDSPTTDHAHHE